MFVELPECHRVGLNGEYLPMGSNAFCHDKCVHTYVCSHIDRDATLRSKPPNELNYLRFIRPKKEKGPLQEGSRIPLDDEVVFVPNEEWNVSSRPPVGIAHEPGKAVPSRHGASFGNLGQ